ncbi:MAG: hypothetical protein JWN44_3209 [Myxococcales bacterium]|nr:hypothetical protein [Myxococcales bacterium]
MKLAVTIAVTSLALSALAAAREGAAPEKTPAPANAAPANAAPPDAASANTAPTPAGGKKYKNVTPVVFNQQILTREAPQLPTALQQRFARVGNVAALKGAYMVSVGTDGRVTHVDVFTSIPDADDEIVATIKKWTFKRQRVPIRSLVTLFFGIPRPKP